MAGIRTPQHLTIAGKKTTSSTLPAMEEVMPAVFGELLDVRRKLEDRYRDMQDIEFTVERGRAVDAANPHRQAHGAGGAEDRGVAWSRKGSSTAPRRSAGSSPTRWTSCCTRCSIPAAKITVLARGLPASPGAASGKIVFSAEEAESCASRGEAVILAAGRNQPRGYPRHARGRRHPHRPRRHDQPRRRRRPRHGPALRRRRRRYSHRLRRSGTMTVRNVLLRAGDLITLNGSTGEIIQGEVPTIEPTLSGDFATLMGWADELRKLGVRANAETPVDARAARNFGAEGIGLSRTEHMFFEADRIGAIREMIMADEERGRRAALAKLLPMQRADFVEIFKIMAGLPVTIRLLDPPLHEFLPKIDSEFEEMAKATGKTVGEIRARALALYETNPMLGHRGCRLGITFPEIYEMQAVAIFEAAVAAMRESGAEVEPEIMVPLIATRREFDILKEMVDRVGAEIMGREGVKVPYHVGTMIELPRAALMAGEIAESAEFFSFGTNDLTQTVYGLSRDDAASFIGAYQRLGIFEHDPFVSLDTEGVGELIKIATERGRKTRPDLKVGICGEHGGDPASIRFCREIGLDYVSCSPYRVPIARLAAAQAELSEDAVSSTA